LKQAEKFKEALKSFGFEPTYKELKLSSEEPVERWYGSFEPTYKELKLYFCLARRN